MGSQGDRSWEKPYLIYYAIANEHLTIFAVLHASRSPEIWPQRL